MPHGTDVTVSIIDNIRDSRMSCSFADCFYLLMPFATKISGSLRASEQEQDKSGDRPACFPRRWTAARKCCAMPGR